MDPAVKTARIAGVWYLLLVITGASSFVVPPSANPTLNSLHIVLELGSTVVFAFLVRALYGLLKGVNKPYALLMAAFVLISVAITFLDGLNQVVALADQGQLHPVTMAFNWFLFGLWLFPFGILVYESGFIPRIFGILLILNGIAYVAEETTSLLSPSNASLVSLVFLAPMFIGELSIMAWLLIKGVRVQPTQALAS